MDVADLLAEEACSCLLHGCDVKDKKYQSNKGHDVILNKIVALYFTSNWCEPCHTFTRVLSQTYQLVEKRASEIVVINVPIESDLDKARYCFKTMPDTWYTISHDNQHVKVLISKFNIQIVPKLVVCKGDGSVITYRGRSEVESKLALAVYNWLDAAKPKPATKQVINGFEIDDVPVEETANDK
ncbi:NXNL2 [Bugula neritina]|uniref:NXNL2 n=1 Tax=Bugula neritina TaxID=10212 RepID=A0A7J7JPG0_BUGNE|nr:NXNL2 [Bugula neritina]